MKNTDKILLLMVVGVLLAMLLTVAFKPKQVTDFYLQDVEYRVKRVLDSDTLLFDAWEVWRGQRYETIYRDKETGCITSR